MKPLLISFILSFTIGIVYGQQFEIREGVSNPTLEITGSMLVINDSAGICIEWEAGKKIKVYDSERAVKQLMKNYVQAIHERDSLQKELDKYKYKVVPASWHYQDSLTASRYFSDSLGNTYMVEYSYTKYDLDLWDGKNHSHWIAICSIIKYRGNKQTTIASGIKAIYSPTECSADNSKLWLQRLYNIQNKRE